MFVVTFRVFRVWELHQTPRMDSGKTKSGAAHATPLDPRTRGHHTATTNTANSTVAVGAHSPAGGPLARLRTVPRDPYDDITAYLERAESERRAFGWGEIAYQYAIDRMNQNDMRYFMTSLVHVFDDPYHADDIKALVPRPELDMLAETFRRAWVDRHGDVSSWPPG